MDRNKEYERELNIAYLAIFALIVFLAGVWVAYIEKCDEIAQQQYEYSVSAQMRAFNQQVNEDIKRKKL